MAGPIIDYQNFVDIRFQDGAEFFVGRIDKVGVAVFVGGEGEKEAVSVALGQIFRADVSAPLEIFDLFYFCGERAKGGFDLLGLVGRAAVFKFEEDYVAQGFFVGGVLLRKSSCEEAQQECSERKNCVHGEHFRQDRVERQWGGFGADRDSAAVAILRYESQTGWEKVGAGRRRRNFWDKAGNDRAKIGPLHAEPGGFVAAIVCRENYGG